MEEKRYCNKCGNELILTNYNAWWCSNCGKLIENNQEEKSEEEYVSYIG